MNILRVCKDMTPKGGEELIITIQENTSPNIRINMDEKMTLSAHLSSLNKDVISYTGNGNALVNKGHCVIKQGRIHALSDEDLMRKHSTLIHYEDGRIEINELIIKDSRIIIQGVDATNEIKWAITGERIIRNGSAVDWRVDDEFKDYADPRHLFKFPLSMGDKRPQGRLDAFREVMWNDSVRKEQGRRGEPVSMPLEIFKKFGFDEAFIKESLKDYDYELSSDSIIMRFNEGIYQHHAIGLTSEGRIMNVIMTSSNRCDGVTINELIDYCKSQRLINAIMIDQGGDAFMWSQGRMIAPSLNNRDKFTSIIALIKQ